MAVSNITKLGERAYLVGGEAVVQFSRGDDASFEPSANAYGWVASVDDGQKSKPILFQPWGTKNDMPQARERLVADNNVVGALMETKRDVHIGLGLMPVVEKFENGARTLHEVAMPPGAAAFFDAINIESFLRDAFGEMAVHGGFVPECVRDKGGRIIGAEVKHARHCRSGRKDVKGRVSAWYWCGDWSRRGNKLFPITEMPVYDPSLEVLKGWKRQARFVMPLNCSLLTDDYYPVPTWQGSRDWIELANLIPQFHLYNLENGFTPRWHVIIPQDYFKGVSPKGMTESQMKDADTQEEAARKDFLNKLNKYLAGLKNAGRALVTDEYFEPLAKQFVGVKITPLQVDLKDEAMLKLYEKSNQAVIAAQGIHPTLAAIESGQTRAGGSEILRALQLYLITKTKQPRATVLQFIKFVHKVNGWDKGVSWAFRDETLTSLADNQNGVMDKKPSMSAVKVKTGYDELDEAIANSNDAWIFRPIDMATYKK